MVGLFYINLAIKEVFYRLTDSALELILLWNPADFFFLACSFFLHSFFLEAYKPDDAHEAVEQFTRRVDSQHNKQQEKEALDSY